MRREANISRLAEFLLVAEDYKYSYDPEHRNRPDWRAFETEKGWSNDPKDDPNNKHQNVPRGTNPVDVSYFEAIKNGNMEAVQKMVDEKAKETGFTRKGIHRTDSSFSVFDNSLSGSKQGNTLGRGFYVALDIRNPEYNSDDYGKNKMNLYVHSERPMILANALSEEESLQVLNNFAKGHDLESYGGAYKQHALKSLQSASKVIDYLKDYAKENGIGTDDILKSLGYDSVKDGPQICIFNSSQIKSSDPIVKDDKGNVIPLSQRFNQNSNDIRY